MTSHEELKLEEHTSAEEKLIWKENKAKFQSNLNQSFTEVILTTDHPIEKRVKSLEQVLFKTSQADRNRLFDHIYERIRNVERK